VVHAQKADRASSSAEAALLEQHAQWRIRHSPSRVFVDAPTPLPLRGVALTRFDGLGHVTQVDHVVFNGGPPPVDWTPATGWYRINADCTGEMELDIPGSPFTPVILRLSVGANGTHINTVVSKPGYVVSDAVRSTRTRTTVIDSAWPGEGGMPRSPGEFRYALCVSAADQVALRSPCRRRKSATMPQHPTAVSKPAERLAFR
jgi:hypothetical protein